MKFKLHIPTEQYGYIEAEIEGTLEYYKEVVEAYHALKEAYQNPDRKTTCIKCREHIDVKEEAKNLFKNGN